MNNNIKAESTEKEIIHIQENLEDEYWSKKYGVTTEELKKTAKNIGISAKIIEANFKKKSFSF